MKGIGELRTGKATLMFTGGSTFAEELGRPKLAAAGCLLMAFVNVSFLLARSR
jgi:hypothetical protein